MCMGAHGCLVVEVILWFEWLPVSSSDTLRSKSLSSFGMRKNMHDYIVEWVDQQKSLIRDGSEKLLEDYRQNWCWNFIHHRLVQVMVLYTSSYYSFNCIISFILILPFIFGVESNELFKSIAWEIWQPATLTIIYLTHACCCNCSTIYCRRLT